MPKPSLTTKRRAPRKMTARDFALLGTFAPPSEREARDQRIRAMIQSIPRGKVASYSQVAAAAGYPMYQRQVARVLRTSHVGLPWQRVVGAGGFIKTKLQLALEQRLLLEMEGVRFIGKHVDLTAHQHVFRTWEL